MSWKPVMMASAALTCLAGPAGALSCTVAASAAAFDSYDMFSGQPTDTTAVVQTSCTTALSIAVVYTVALSTGSSGSYGQRTMVNGVSSLAYQIYANSAHSLVWGDGTGGSTVQTDGYLLLLLTNVTHSFTAYGRIPAGQTGVSAGSYNDALLITMTY